MTTRIILPALLLSLLSSCAAYRSGMTPDDVYYSPERERVSYTSYRQESTEDIRLRQQVRDARLRTLDDDYFYDWRRFSGWNNQPLWTPGWNNPFFWQGNGFSSFNQPFLCIPGTNYVITKPTTGTASTPAPRYYPVISALPPSTVSSGGNGKFNLPSTNNQGSRFFGGAFNQSSGNNRYSNSGFGTIFQSGSGGGSRLFNSGSSGGGGRQTSGSSSQTVRGRKN